MAMDRLERASDFFPVQRRFHPIKLGHPTADDSIREAARSVLVFRPLPPKQSKQFAFLLSRNHLDAFHEGLVAKVLIFDFLMMIFAVEKFTVEKPRATVRKIAIGLRVLLFIQRPGHQTHGAESADIDAAAHAIRTPELDVVGVVVRLEEPAAPVGVPCADAIVETLFGLRVERFHPGRVSGNLPVTIKLENASELAVGGRMEAMARRPIRQCRPEIHMPALVHGPLQLLFAQSAFQGREKMAQGLGVIPDVSAGTVTAARADKTSFPSPDVPVFLP